MAKRKDSVALFEVITAAKRKEAAAASSRGVPMVSSVLRTPRWWFKNRKAGSAQPAGVTEGDPTYPAPQLPSPAHAAPQLSAPAEVPAPAPAAAAVNVVQRVAPAPERVSIPEHTRGVDPFGLDAPAEQKPARPRRAWLGFGARKIDIDPTRREVTLRVRYTTAIIVGFALCVAVGLAYVTGRQTNRAAAGPNTVTSEAVRQGKINPRVLDIRLESGTGGGGTPVVDDEMSPPSGRDPSAGRTKAGPKPLAPPPPPPELPGNKPRLPGASAVVEVGKDRVVGLNYVIVQSYPERKSAIEAQKLLEAAGIPCTVENSPKNWAADSSWWSVIGIHGFARPKSTPEFEQYVDSIIAAGKKVSGNKIKKFEPMAYKWKG